MQGNGMQTAPQSQIILSKNVRSLNLTLLKKTRPKGDITGLPAHNSNLWLLQCSNHVCPYEFPRLDYLRSGALCCKFYAPHIAILHPIVTRKSQEILGKRGGSPLGPNESPTPCSWGEVGQVLKCTSGFCLHPPAHPNQVPSTSTLLLLLSSVPGRLPSPSSAATCSWRWSFLWAEWIPFSQFSTLSTLQITQP